LKTLSLILSISKSLLKISIMFCFENLCGISSSGKFFLGIIFYLIIIIAIAVTALFYIQIEVFLKKKFSRTSNVLATIHLIGMNVGGAGAMMIMTFAGLAGTGLITVFTEGKLGPKDPAIMDSFIEPIGGFIALLAIGVICGGLCFISAYRNNSQSVLE